MWGNGPELRLHPADEADDSVKHVLAVGVLDTYGGRIRTEWDPAAKVRAFGKTVKVTDPAGKWQKTETDAMGNLTRVWEPQPAAGGADYETSYSYSVLGQLLTVTMARPGYKVGDPATVTQTRSWVYDSGTQRLSSVTHPESGTTSYLI